MVKKSKLLAALDAHKGRDYEAEKIKKQVKTAEKRKRNKIEAAASEADNDVAGEQGQDMPKTKKSKKVRIAAISSDKTTPATGGGVLDDQDEEDMSSASLDESGDRLNGATIPQPEILAEASASEADPESDIDLSDLEGEDMEDAIPHQRLTINNGPALLASKKRITLAKPKMPFHLHNSLISTLPPSDEVIPDANDDLTRELEFYRIARDAVTSARSKLKAEKVPFTRPSDYFAEMVKTDEHMGKVKKRLYDEAAGKKASEEAKKLRDAKKFGKAVQIAKEQERAKEKRGTLDKIKELKKRRKGEQSTATTEADDLFQEIAVENDNSKTSSSNKKRPFSSSTSTADGANNKRQKRDSKFGFGGKKRFSKSGDAISSSDLSGFSARGMKGKGGSGGGAGAGAAKGKRPTTRRLGKSKRAAGRA